MENIVILYGGKSGEHEVSLRSAASVLQNLDKSKYSVHLIGVSKEGLWFYQTDPESYLDEEVLPLKTDYPASIQPGRGFFVNGEEIKCDVVFPVVHGTQGEDGAIPGLLEVAEKAYVGSGILGSSLSLDKEKVKKIWESEGIPVVPYTAFNKIDKIDYDSVIQQLSLPIFVKPARTGSSVGVSKAENIKELKSAVKKAFLFDSKVILESSIDAREIECSVIGNYIAKAYVPGEIRPKHHKFYDYDAKYIDPDGAQLIIPAEAPEAVLNEIKEIAETAYLLAEARGMSRVDFFLDKNNGKIYLNEINTIPGFTSISMFAKMCEAGGLTYSKLLDELITLAKELFKERESLKYSI